MGWRALASGLALTATLLLPMAIVRPASALDRVVILSTYRSFVSANMLPRMMGHAGVDFGEQLGAPVLAAAPGTVSRVINWPPGCGAGVVIEHPRFKRWTAYCHLQTIMVEVGQQMARGEQIGEVSKSGDARNIPHVHLELCTSACASHADGDLAGTVDPLRIAEGCYDESRRYPTDRLVLTFPVPCLFWLRGK